MDLELSVGYLCTEYLSSDFQLLEHTGKVLSRRKRKFTQRDVELTRNRIWTKLISLISYIFFALKNYVDMFPFYCLITAYIRIHSWKHQIWNHCQQRTKRFMPLYLDFGFWDHPSVHRPRLFIINTTGLSGKIYTPSAYLKKLQWKLKIDQSQIIQITQSKESKKTRNWEFE